MKKPMNPIFIDILQKIIAEHGREVLLNSAKCKAFLADYTKGEYKKESRLLLQALEAGVQKAIDTTVELEICKKQQARVLQEEYFLMEEIAVDVVDTLVLVLRGEQENKTLFFCSNCGKELQNEWKACPYCLTSVAKLHQKTTQHKLQPLPSPAPVTQKKFSNATSDEKKNVLHNMVLVEGGTFQMGGGDNDEKSMHTVTVSSFNINKYEVTQKEWQEVMGNNPSNFRGENLPVETVSWFDAIEYCNKRSLKEGLTPVYRGSGDNITCDWNINGYRLPTEAEWEFAAKGGTKVITTQYSGSNRVDAVAWYDRNSGGRTQPVGTKAANSLGIHDMSGNVWEWCWDWYGSYSSSSQIDPRGSVSGTARVLRGGSWGNSTGFVRLTFRAFYAPEVRDRAIGLRLVRL